MTTDATASRTADDAGKDAAEARKAAVDAARAGLPAASSTPLGAVPAFGQGAGYLSQWVVHQALEDVADGVAEAVRSLPSVTGVLLLEDRDLVARDWAWAQVTGELARRLRRLESARRDVEAVVGALEDAARRRTDAPADDALAHAGQGLRTAGATLSPLEAGAAHVASAADLVGLFASEWAVTSTAVTATTGPLTAAVADRLGAATVPVLVDRFRLVDAEGPVYTALDSTLRSAVGLAQQRRRLEAHLPPPADEEPDLVARARRVLVEARAVAAEWDASLAALTTAGPGGVAPLAAAALQAAVHGRDSAVSHVVTLSVDSAGADVVARRHLFAPGSRVWLVGGVTVSVLALRTADGALIQARTLRRGRRVRYDLASGRHDGSRPDATTHDGALGSVGPVRTSWSERIQVAAVGVVGLLAATWLAVDVLQRIGVIALR